VRPAIGSVSARFAFRNFAAMVDWTLCHQRALSLEHQVVGEDSAENARFVVVKDVKPLAAGKGFPVKHRFCGLACAENSRHGLH
jgi:hypothetical protein